MMNEKKICHRCGEISSKLYCLSEHFANVKICYNCAMKYHDHKQEFVDDIYTRMKERLENE